MILVRGEFGSTVLEIATQNVITVHKHDENANQSNMQAVCVTHDSLDDHSIDPSLFDSASDLWFLGAAPVALTPTSLPDAAKCKHSASVLIPLRNWLNINYDYPYPTILQKTMLAQESGLNTVQVSHWFNNARKRLLNDNYYRKGMGKGKRTTGKKVEAKNLQGQVQDALRARHERDAREQTLSAEIAAQHPI